MAQDLAAEHPAGTSPEVEAVFNGHPTTRPNTGPKAVPKTRPREGPKADVREMVRAFELAQVAHEGQLRKSGELFIEHPIGVARILARLGMDSTTIVGALLHDAVEDTDVELEDIEASFGAEVAGIIDGLTKLDKIQFRSKEQEKAENL